MSLLLSQLGAAATPTPDDDRGWSPPIVALAAAPSTSYIGRDDDFAPAGAQPGGGDEERAWTPSVTTTADSPVAVFADRDDVPAGALRGQPDEDFWISKVAPVAPTMLVRVPLVDSDDPAGSLRGQPDEDFWRSGVAPEAAALRVVLPLGDPEELPAATLWGQPDEDTWTAPVTQSIASPTRVAIQIDDDFIPPAVATIVDEDYQVQVTPFAAPRVPVAFTDANELAGSGKLDDDSMWPRPLPVAPVLRVVAAADTDDVAGFLYGQPDEDFWSSGVAPVAASMRVSVPLLDTDDPAATLRGQPDEDFWINGVAPVPTAMRVALPFVDTDEPAATLRGQPDEDRWSSGVAPVPSVVYQRLPIGDPEEVPGGALFGQPDEDFWQNPVAPVAPSLLVRLPLGDPEELAAGALYGTPDEDFWVRGVAPVPATVYQRLPLPESDSGDATSPVADHDTGAPRSAPWVEAPAIAARGVDDEFAPVEASVIDEDPRPQLVGVDLPWWRTSSIVDLTDLPPALTVDESTWSMPPPVAPSSSWYVPASPDEAPQSVATVVDEEGWIAPRPISSYAASPIPLDVEDLPNGAFLEDDGGRIARALVDWSYTRAALVPLDEDVPSRALEETQWIAAAPIASPAYAVRPLLELDQEPAGVLYGMAIEDFWINQVAPIPALLYVRLPLGDPEEIPAGYLYRPELLDDFDVAFSTDDVVLAFAESTAMVNFDDGGDAVTSITSEGELAVTFEED